MNDFAEVIALVEGPTEQRFIKEIPAPYLAAGRLKKLESLVGGENGEA